MNFLVNCFSLGFNDVSKTKKKNEFFFFSGNASLPLSNLLLGNSHKTSRTSALRRTGEICFSHRREKIPRWSESRASLECIRGGRHIDTPGALAHTDKRIIGKRTFRTRDNIYAKRDAKLPNKSSRLTGIHRRLFLSSFAKSRGALSRTQPTNRKKFFKADQAKKS